MRTATKVFRRIGGVLCAIMTGVVVLAIVLVNIGAPLFSQAITMYVGANDTKVEGGDGTQYYQSDYASADDEHEAAAKVARQIEAEGITLLANEGAALPLDAGAKVSVFGQDSVDLLYGGSGSASIDASEAGTLKDALEQAGLQVNPTLWDFYESGPGSSYRKSVPSVTGSGDFAVNEVPQSAYTDEVKASYADYADAAIVVIGRTGAESTDLTTEYLQLTSEEEDEIHAAAASFNKVVLLLNTANPVELGGWREQGVDAIVWMGMPGQAGVDAVGDVLRGFVNPSGSTVDTYAASAASAPAAANLGDYTITNTDVESANKYLSYSEGIYVGYRYYETRYEDAMLGQGNAGDFDYGEEVVFPFGHGLSYTTFQWSDYTVADAGDSYTASITVTNTGQVAGKDTVELYLQKPYTDYDKANGIEKSAVELVGFEKTKLLEPGESQQLTATVSKESLYAYDAKGAGTYIVEPGTYYLAAGPDAHAALNSILAAKSPAVVDFVTGDSDESLCWSLSVASLEGAETADAAGEATSVVLYDATASHVSASTGNAITDQFQDADLTTYDADFRYLSRSDWQGTWPTTYQDGSWEAPQELIDATRVQNGWDESAQMPTFDSTSTSLTLAQLIGASYDDPRWDQLMDQMGKQELWNLVRRSGYLSLGIDSIGMPQVTLKDGSSGISGTLTGGGVACMGYPVEVVLASTYNRDLARQMGQMVGEDSLASGVAVWYAPTMNIHRAATCGRNFEYYSEDGYLSGQMGAAETQGAQSKGCVVTIKHLALNDQETNRYGVLVFANEQAIRELYLRGFEASVREGGARGVMAAMNRVGPRWAGGDAGLMTQVLRGEWGFTGFVTTDQATFPTFNYCDIREGLVAGTDMWLNTGDLMNNDDVETIDASTWQAVRRAAHRILYVYANSNAMNGISADATLHTGFPTWRWLVLAVTVLMVLFGWVWYKLCCLCFHRRTLWQVWRKKPVRGGLKAL